MKYNELTVWQKAMDLVECVYKISYILPKEEKYALSDQLRRAVVSIPSNIAEGAGRKSTKDYVHFLNIARGSAYEVETQLHVCRRLKLVPDETLAEAFALAEEVTKMINAICVKLG